MLERTVQKAKAQSSQTAQSYNITYVPDNKGYVDSTESTELAKICDLLLKSNAHLLLWSLSMVLTIILI